MVTQLRDDAFALDLRVQGVIEELGYVLALVMDPGPLDPGIVRLAVWDAIVRFQHVASRAMAPRPDPLADVDGLPVADSGTRAVVTTLECAVRDRIGFDRFEELYRRYIEVKRLVGDVSETGRR